MKTIIHNGIVVCNGDLTIEGGYIYFDENGIIELGEGDGYLKHVDPDVELVDGKRQWITPGMIDIHNHGALGIDFVSANNQEINLVAKALIKEGVTGFLASTAPDTVEKMAEMAQRLGSYVHTDGAVCLGIHMEGPYMSEKHRALMLPEYLRDASIEEYNNWQKLSNNFVKSITLAPERPGSIKYIKEVGDDVAIMIGHTSCTAQDVIKAHKAGARGFTHFYNAMSQHGHRAPGAVTGGFMVDDLYCELVADGVHVDKDVVSMTLKNMTAKRIILISDAMPGKWMEDGKFFFCNSWVIKENGMAHLEGETRIAGSVMPLNKIANNVYKWCQCSINEIVQMVSVNPAKLLKENKIGQLKRGYDADVVIYDNEFNPLKVYVKGIEMK